MPFDVGVGWHRIEEVPCAFHFNRWVKVTQPCGPEVGDVREHALRPFEPGDGVGEEVTNRWDSGSEGFPLPDSHPINLSRGRDDDRHHFTSSLIAAMIAARSAWASHVSLVHGSASTRCTASSIASRWPIR
jgi:hypothetical protein